MCIFTQPVTSVNNTQIFARRSGNGTQFLAYQMSYESQEPNAMILPLPVKKPANDQTLNFIDLKNYDAFFDKLADGFPFHSPSGIGCSMPSSANVTCDSLEVFKVGNYIASFVPTLADFDRLDSKFTLPAEIWANIPRYEDFGFAVFQLAAGSLKPHPMAFEFQTENDEIFFPTIHIHDGEIHEAEEFDHMLYVQHAGLDSRVHGYQNSDVEDKSTGLIRSKYRASHFCDIHKSMGLIDGDLLLHRKIIRGQLPNKDTTFAFSGDPNRRSLNLRPWLSYSPWLVVLAATGWFFNRRSKLKKRRESKSTDPHGEIMT